MKTLDRRCTTPLALACALLISACGSASDGDEADASRDVADTSFEDAAGTDSDIAADANDDAAEEIADAGVTDAGEDAEEDTTEDVAPDPDADDDDAADAASDVLPDAEQDTSADVSPDAEADADSDVSLDAQPDTTVDIATDAEGDTDANTDVPDVAPDIGEDTSTDAEPDLPDDAGPDDAGPDDTGPDADAPSNLPPSATFVSPEPGVSLARTGTQRFRVRADDPDDDSARLELRFTYGGGIPLVPAIYEGGGLWVLDTEPLPRGEHTVVVRVTDPRGLEDTAAIDVVSNTPPGRPGVQLNPLEVTARDSVAVIITQAEDLDRDAITTQVRWTRNDEPQPELNDQLEVPAGRLVRGDGWRVSAQHDDGLALGEAQTQSLVVDNAAPVLGDVTLTSLDEDGQRWRCGALVDDPDGGVALDVAWFLSDTQVATGAEYTLPSIVAGGSQLRCVVTATDDRDVSVSDEATVSVGNFPPVISSIAITTDGEGVMFDTYVCDVDAIDPEGGDLALTYTWFTLRDDDPSREREFGAASTDVVDLRDFVAPGDTFYCRATATDDAGDRAAATASFVLGNLTPYTEDVAATSPASTVRTGSQARCSYRAEDDDHFELTYRYDWFVGDTQVGTGTTLTPDGVSVSRGDTLRCTATASDPLGASVSSSTTLEVMNGLPRVVSIAVSEPLFDVSLSAACLAEVVDPDGDDVSLDYSWAFFPGGLGTTLPWDTQVVDGPFEGGVRYSCAARPSDPFENGRSEASEQVLAEISVAPIVSLITLAPAEPGTDDTIEATWEVEDPNSSQTVTIGIDWRVNGVTVATSGTSLDGSFFEAGDVVTLLLTPDDGLLVGETASASVTIGNSRPTIESVALVPAPAVRGRDALRCAVGAVSDGDGDSVEISLSWAWRASRSFSSYRDIETTPFSTTLSADTLPPTAPAGLYRCTVTAEDSRAGVREVQVEAGLLANPFTLRGPGDGFGEVMLVGNADGDSIDDLLLPSPDNESRQAQLVAGIQTPGLQGSSIQNGTLTGISGFDLVDDVAFAFVDIDADGLDDIVAVASKGRASDPDNPWAGGGIWVFSATGYPTDLSLLMPEDATFHISPSETEELLAEVWTLGDIDADGSDDLLVRTRNSDGSTIAHGYVLTRDSFDSASLSGATWRVSPMLEGNRVMIADITADGRRDVLFDAGVDTWIMPMSTLPAPGPVTYGEVGWTVTSVLPAAMTAYATPDFDGDGTDDILLHDPRALDDNLRVLLLSGLAFREGGDGYDGVRIALLPPTGSYELSGSWATMVAPIGDLDGDGTGDVFVRYHRSYELYQGLSERDYSLGCVVFGGTFIDTPADRCVAYGGVDVRSGGSAVVADIDGDGVDDLYAVNASYVSTSPLSGVIYGLVQPEGFAACTPAEAPSLAAMIEDKAVAYDILPCVCGSTESCWQTCEASVASAYGLSEPCAAAARQLLECATNEECTRECRGTDAAACRACLLDECRGWAFASGYDASVR